MNLSHDAADFAERTYGLKREEIMQEYHEKKRNLQFVSFTQSRADIRVQQLLPETMRALSNALVNAWFDAFDLEGKYLRIRIWRNSIGKLKIFLSAGLDLLPTHCLSVLPLRT